MVEDQNLISTTSWLDYWVHKPSQMSNIELLVKSIQADHTHQLSPTPKLKLQ
jgi:hypothetical protein